MARTPTPNELLVIAKVDLTEYYNRFVVPLSSLSKRNFKPMSAGDNTGLCPFHKDTDPSFHNWKKKGIFHCFGCGFGGSVVATHMQLRRQYYGENLKIEKAIEQLAAEFSIELNMETGNEIKSVFERARELMFQRETYIIPKDVLSLAEFRQLNNRVKRTNLPMNVKVQNFEQLDLVASVAQSNQS